MMDDVKANIVEKNIFIISISITLTSKIQLLQQNNPNTFYGNVEISAK